MIDTSGVKVCLNCNTVLDSQAETCSRCKQDPSHGHGRSYKGSCVSCGTEIPGTHERCEECQKSYRWVMPAIVINSLSGSVLFALAAAFFLALAGTGVWP